MAELIVVGFKKDMYRASVVLNKLQDLEFDWVFDLRDAAAVYRDNAGELRVDQSYEMMTCKGPARDGLWGALIGATLEIPSTTRLSAEASSWKSEFGIPDDFVRQVGALVQSGDSAIFAILRMGDPEVIAEEFRCYGGTVLRLRLSRDQEEKVEKFSITSNGASPFSHSFAIGQGL